MCQHHLAAKDAPGEGSIREAFVEAVVDILRDWHDDILTALDEGALTEASEGATRQAIARLLDTYRDAIGVEYETIWVDSAEAGRAATVRRFDLDVDPRVEDELIRELTEYAAAASDELQGRMTRDIARALRDAWDDGLGQPEIERILSEEVFPEMRGYEAERAARTEGTAAAGRGAVSSIQDAGAPGKEWLAEDDTRTRTSHREADGQVVPVGADFEIDGADARWPGDPRLPIGERANCRCNVAPVWEL